jgi:AraC family transcriptional regulator
MKPIAGLIEALELLGTAESVFVHDDFRRIGYNTTENHTQEVLIMEEYSGRINRVIDYIETNLANSFTLDELASVAHFSKFHFHRIFFSLMGETLFRFIQRIRLEKAANRLVYELNTPITPIALECGFSSSAAFSKAFKEHFQCSPSAWRKRALYSNPVQSNSNPGKVKSKEMEVSHAEMRYLGQQNEIQRWELTARQRTQMIEVVHHPITTVVYLRHVGPYQQDIKLFERLNTRLFTWAAAQGLLRFPETQFLIISHDDPGLTAASKLRISVCLTAPDDVAVEGEFGKLTIPAGLYAHIKFKVDPLQIGEAWSWVYGCWLLISGFIPDDRPSFELYPISGLEQTPVDEVELDICIPVRPI